MPFDPPEQDEEYPPRDCVKGWVSISFGAKELDARIRLLEEQNAALEARVEAIERRLP